MVEKKINRIEQDSNIRVQTSSEKESSIEQPIPVVLELSAATPGATDIDDLREQAKIAYSQCISDFGPSLEQLAK